MLSIGSTAAVALLEAAAVALLDAAALAAAASFLFGFLSGPFFLCAWARSDVQLFTHTYGVYVYMYNWSERERDRFGVDGQARTHTKHVFVRQACSTSSTVRRAQARYSSGVQVSAASALGGSRHPHINKKEM